MMCTLAMHEPIEFPEDYPRGIMGKIGGVTMNYRCIEYFDGFDKSLSELLEKLQDSSEYRRDLRIAVILKEPQSLCQGVVQLIEEDSSLLMDVNSLPGVENVRVKVTLSQLRDSSWPSSEDVKSDIFTTKEMTVSDDLEKTCEDNAVQFQDESWYKMFKTRGETISARISIEMTINFSSDLEQAAASPMKIETMVENINDDKNGGTMIAKNGTHIQCQKAVLALCSSSFTTMFRTGPHMDSSIHELEKLEMTEEGVQSYLDYLYCQNEEGQSKDSEVALELFMFADKYDDIPYIEAAMSSIFLAKPASWYNVEVAFKLFVFARNTARDELKMKAVQVLKHHCTTLLESGEILFKENPEAALELCYMAFNL